MLTARQIEDLLKLRPLPVEGGLFAESYRSSHMLSCDALREIYPGAYSSAHHVSTAIYYMLTPGTFSAMHRLKGDEIFHFYLGDPVEMLMLKPDRSAEAVLLGQDILAGMRLQHVVPAGTWQGARLAPGGKFALMGTTMAPGFDPQDYEPGARAELAKHYPKYAPLIGFLTR